MIMIIEDEAVSRRALSQLLAMDGYQTKAVGSAEEALELVSHGEMPEVVLVDVDLPGMSGVELVEDLSRRNPRLHPVFITACDRDVLPLGTSTNPPSYLRKPLNIQDLLELMADQLAA